MISAFKDSDLLMKKKNGKMMKQRTLKREILTMITQLLLKAILWKVRCLLRYNFKLRTLSRSLKTINSRRCRKSLYNHRIASYRLNLSLKYDIWKWAISISQQTMYKKVKRQWLPACITWKWITEKTKWQIWQQPSLMHLYANLHWEIKPHLSMNIIKSNKRG